MKVDGSVGVSEGASAIEGAIGSEGASGSANGGASVCILGTGLMGR